MLEKLKEISISKTIRMNWHYFGIRGIVNCYIIAAKNLKILRLKGSIKFEHEPQFGMIQIGFSNTGVFDKKYERSIWDNAGLITVSDTVKLFQGARISNTGCINFNGECSIGSSTIICEDGIDFGNNVLISWNDLIMDCDFHKIYDINEDKSVEFNKAKKILISDNVWIGCNSTILKGTVIPKGTVIAACSCISGEIRGENQIIGDNKRVLRKNILWEQ